MSQLTHVGGSFGSTFHVLFVHGLGGDSKQTWTGSEGQFWPKWLADDLKDACVWCLSYDAPISRWKREGMHVLDLGSNIASSLIAEKRIAEKRIAFVTHSLGGLVVKQALRTLDSNSYFNQSSSLIANSIDSLVFIATPHTGSALASNAITRIVKPTATTRSIGLNDRALNDLNNWYRNWSVQRIRHLVFSEMLPERFGCGMISFQIVKPNSADPGLYGANPVPISRDHVSIVKILSRGDDVYTQTLAFLRDSLSEKRVAVVSTSSIEQRIARIETRLLGVIESPRIRDVSLNPDMAESAVVVIEADLQSSIPRDGLVVEDLKDGNLLKISQKESHSVGVVSSYRRFQERRGALSVSAEAIRESTQASAMAEVGIKKDDPIVAKRGIDILSSSIQNISDAEIREFFKQKLVDLMATANSKNLRI